MSMRVVQVIGTLRGGGAERVAITLHKGFKKLGIDSKIMLLSKKIDYEIKDDDILFAKHPLEIDADLIIAHMEDASKVVANYKDAWHVIHNTYSYKFKQKNFFSSWKHFFNYKKLYNNKKLIAVSKGVEKDIKENLKIKPKALKTIYNPFDIEAIRILGEEKIDIEYDYIINVAALTKVKNQALLLKAFAKIKTPLHLLLLGKGNQEANLKALAKELQIQDRVHFLGWQSNPYKYIKNAKAFVLSSNIEGLPTVLIESLILNTPVVSTNCPSGPSEILIDELKPFLVEVGNEKELKEKIKLALEKYPTITEKYTQRFDYVTIAKEYLALKGN
jgi:glycosyltransferase involved in cell wall biosynthesis